MKIYIAGGFFNDEQNKIIDDLEYLLRNHQTFSPRRDNLGVLGCDWDSIYKRNIHELHNCDIVVASTANKDMGTIFECGYSTAIDKPVVYYAPNLNGPFNLMLARGARAVLTSFKEMEDYINKGMPKQGYVGGIE
ncbi:MAG: nucleoside 2-deoxyribosyltransferase [Ignisphaera sp.]|nr:nucleoside 2-deoxyribosyltransferase [Ignisphaera sp.]